MTKRKPKPLRFEDLQKIAFHQFTGKMTPEGLGDRVDQVLDCARINADDTCCVEKSLPMAEYDAVALETVCGILSSRDADDEVRGWFKAQGVQW